MIQVATPYGNQVWIAGNNGLYMYDGNKWYRYGIDIKRERWEGSSWAVDTRYIVGETKLFAAKEGSVNQKQSFLDCAFVFIEKCGCAESKYICSWT